MGDTAQKRRGTFRGDRSDAAVADPKARKHRSPLLKIEPKSYPRISEKRLLKAITSLPGYDPYADKGDTWFDWKAAKHVVEFFHRELSHVKGDLARQPFILEEWEIGIVANLFGWKQKRVKGRKDIRRFQEAFVFIARKNGKTPMAAGLANYLFVVDDEPGVEISSSASTRDQARLCWSWAQGMIRNDKMLDEMCKIFQHSITKVDDLMASYKPMAADAGSLHGANLHGEIIDELHTFTKVNEEVIHVLETSTAARRQPLVAMITTAGWDRNSICYKKYDYAKRVQAGDDGYRDAAFLPVIYEATVEEDWTDEAIWCKANPNLGVSVKWDYFRSEFKRAVKDAAYENRFRQLHLNQWTEQSVRWIRMDDWDKCGLDKFDLADLDGRKCYGGFDLGISRDLTALALVFPDDDEGVTVAVWHWIPEVDAREREERDKVPYREWARAGLVEMTPGNVTDLGRIENRILELKERYQIQSIGFDPWKAEVWAAKMQEKHGMAMVKIPQNIKAISEPAENFHRLVLSGKLRHGGNPMLRWQAGNVEVYIDPNDNVKPKKSSESNRIDGIIATIMALKLALLDNQGGSIYNSRGPIVLDF